MDRYAFLASQPWLHELGGATLSLQPQQDAGQDTSGAVDAAEERLIAALGYQFKVEKLFSGVCCLHLLPLPQGVVVTPNSHCLFFDEGDRALDPAQLNTVLGDHPPSTPPDIALCSLRWQASADRPHPV